MSSRRVAALGALIFGIGSVALAVVVVFQEFPQGLVVLGLVGVAVFAGWYGASCGAVWPGRSG